MLPPHPMISKKKCNNSIIYCIFAFQICISNKMYLTK